MAGEPTPLVLVHGWGGSAASWGPVVAELDGERWRPVIAVALPGAPDSRSARPASIHDAAAEVIETLSALDRPAIVVGHSMGAQATLLAAGAVPELVLGEVVIDPAYNADGGDRAELADWAGHIATAGHAAVEGFFADAAASLGHDGRARVLRDLAETPATTIEAYLRSEYLDDDAIGLSPRSAAAAAARRRPVLALHSNAAAARRSEQMPAPRGSRVVVWLGHGHYLHLEAPARFVGLLDQWRAELEVTTGREPLPADR